MSGRFSQNDLVTVSRETEVTPGVVVGGARSRVYGTAPTYTPGGNTNSSGINTGDGGEHSHRAGLRYGDAEIPSQLVFGLNDLEWEDQMRQEYQASELTISGSFTFAQAGTHVDGSTGPVITATAGTFDDLFDTEDFAGLMMEISGVAINAANKWPRAVKDVKSDGSQIDIEPLYAAAGAGLFRETLFSESGKAGVIRFGKWLRNQGIELIRSCNFEFNHTDQPGGSFALVTGCHGSGLKLSFTGKGIVEVSFMYVGMDYSALSTTSVGSSVTANPFISNDVISSAEDLAYFAVGGTTLLSADNLTSFTLDGNGNASGIDDVSGTRSRPGVTVGDMVFSGSLKVYHKHALSTILVALGRNGNKVPIDFKLIDPAGNFYWGRLPTAMFEPNAPKQGAKGSKTDNSLNYKTQLGPRSERTFIWQRFAAT